MKHFLTNFSIIISFLVHKVLFNNILSIFILFFILDVPIENGSEWCSNEKHHEKLIDELRSRL